MNFFDILHDDRAQHRATFGPGVRFQKNNPGIRRGLSVINGFFLHFLRNATIIFFDILQDDRAQHRATFRPGVRFKKK